MFLTIRKPGWGTSNSTVPTAIALSGIGVWQASSFSLVSDDVPLGYTFGKILALYMHVVCPQVCALTFTGFSNKKTFCTKVAF